MRTFLRREKDVDDSPEGPAHGRVGLPPSSATGRGTATIMAIKDTIMEVAVMTTMITRRDTITDMITRKKKQMTVNGQRTLE